MDWSGLLEIISRLRSPQGCPWDRAQTHQSLKQFLLEESYELLEAIDQENPEAIKDELGDVLLQVLLHAQIAGEKGEFDIVDVLRNLRAKMIRRHPHVFTDLTAHTPEEVIQTWDAIKQTEQAGANRRSILDGVPRVFPALMRAEKIQERAAKVGFDWSETSEVLKKVQEELFELETALDQGDQPGQHEELGDLLFAAVNLARFLKVDPEFALQEATAKFEQRFHLLEQAAQEQRVELSALDPEALDRLWEQAKAQLRRNPQD